MWAPLAQASFLKAHPECLASDPAARDLLARSARDFVPVDPIHPATLGFRWNDFTLAPDEPGFGVDPGRAFVYGRDATRFLLARSRTASNAVHAVFRGHQQASVPNPMMRRLVASRGVFRHWQDADAAARLDAPAATVASWIEKAPDRAVPEGSVWTFNIAPDTAYGIANGFATGGIAGSVNEPLFEAAPGEQHGVAAGPVIAAAFPVDLRGFCRIRW